MNVDKGNTSKDSKLCLYHLIKLHEQLWYLQFIFHQEQPSYLSTIIDKWD